MPKFRIVKNASVEQPWHIQIVADNGEILMVSENYSSHDNANKAVARLRVADLLSADLEEVEVTEEAL